MHVKRIAWTFVVIATLVPALFLLLTSRLAAQPPQPVQAPPTYQDVPDTPAPSPAPIQPIPYSHKTHLALGIQCQTCHSNPAPRDLMTFPAPGICMQCHATIATDKPAIQKLTEYDKSKTLVPWVRVYVVLPGTGWSHGKHLDAGMKCEMCHGQVAQMDKMANVKSVTSMGGCRDCHNSHHAPTTCVTCHAAWDVGMVVRK